MDLNAKTEEIVKDKKSHFIPLTKDHFSRTDQIQA
jgi:hypothetical protein